MKSSTFGLAVSVLAFSTLAVTSEAAKQRINVFVNRDLDFTGVYAVAASAKQPGYVLLR